MQAASIAVLRRLIVLIVCAAVTAGVSTARGATALVREISLPPMSSPSTIALGPDGAVWFTEEGTNRIGRITPAGALTEFPVPTPNATVGGIGVGPDGNMWFVETKSLKLARLVPSTGQITEFRTPVAANGVVGGSDGNLWVVGSAANRILVVSTAGKVLRTLTVPTANAFPHGASLGPDGNVYFAEFNGNKIGRVTPTGVFREWAIPSPATKPFRTTFGPDGRAYFTENAGNRIGRLDPSTGAFAQFAIPTPSSAPAGITTGPDGNIWFTETRGNRIGRVTTAGSVTEFPIPTASSTPKHIAAGADGNLWFTEATANQVGVLTPPGSSPPPPPSPPADISAPTVTGAASVGGTLTASPGSWSGSPSFTYQWERCDAGGGNCSPIAAATSSTYVVAAADVGSTLTAVVTATNTAGSATATSSPTAIVTTATVTPPSTPVLDDFNRAAGAAGPNWSVMRATTFAPLAIAGNVASDASTTSFAWDFWNAATFGPDCEAYVTIAGYGPSDTIRLGARISGGGTTSYGGYYVSVSATGTWAIIRIDNGRSTTLASGPTAPLASGDRVAIRIVGSTITALHGSAAGWVLVLSYDTAQDAIRYTGAGNLGVEFRTSTIDDFGGGSLP